MNDDSGKDVTETRTSDNLDLSVDDTQAEPTAEKTYAGMTRRTLIGGVCGIAALMVLGGFKTVGEQPILRPPGGQEWDDFISKCIRCEKCVEVCPQQIITPAHLESGLLNTRTPTLNLNVGWCDWCADTNNGVPRCIEVCPTNALELPADAAPENTILGKAVINRDWCLAWHLIGCRFCYDACPYEAIELDDEGRPYVIEDKCNGCGACQSVCVSMENGAIAPGANARAITVHPLNENGEVIE